MLLSKTLDSLRDEALLRIMKRKTPFTSLVGTMNDRADIREVACWQIGAAMREAFEAGRKAERGTAKLERLAEDASEGVGHVS